MKISRRNFCLLMAGACCTGVLAACVYGLVWRSIRFCGGIRRSPQ